MGLTSGSLPRDANRVALQQYLQVPYIGKIFYVDPTNGSDTVNGGTRPHSAYKTLTKAYAALTDNNHDVIILIPGGVGSGTGTVETAVIDWSVNLAHLIGNVSNPLFSSRARITTTTASVTPFITVSGQGNSFHNIQITSAVATGLVALKVSSHRNFFQNCHIGVSIATALDDTAASHLLMSGAQENHFKDCVIGFDTINTTAAVENIKFELNGTTRCARNVFEDCIFPVFADAAAPFFITVGAQSCDRFNMFKRCVFHNAVGSGATTMTDACSVDTDPGGVLIMQDCLKIGATGWGDNLAHIYLLGDSSNSTYNQGIGFAVNPAA